VWIKFVELKIITIMFITCNWVVTRWQWLFNTYTKHEVGTKHEVWIVAALLAISTAISTYLFNESMILGHKTYCQVVVMFEQLVYCVVPMFVCLFLRHDRPPSCGKLLLCI
jgi:hypothetical protein